MGVPVITLNDQNACGRLSASVLHQVGLENLIAKTREQYVAIAVELATDIEKLTVLRKGLRNCLRESRLCDGKLFAKNIEEAYRDMWRRWCSVGK